MRKNSLNGETFVLISFGVYVYNVHVYRLLLCIRKTCRPNTHILIESKTKSQSHTMNWVEFTRFIKCAALQLLHRGSNMKFWTKLSKNGKKSKSNNRMKSEKRKLFLTKKNRSRTECFVLTRISIRIGWDILLFACWYYSIRWHLFPFQLNFWSNKYTAHKPKRLTPQWILKITKEKFRFVSSTTIQSNLFMSNRVFW